MAQLGSLSSAMAPAEGWGHPIWCGPRARHARSASRPRSSSSRTASREGARPRPRSNSTPPGSAWSPRCGSAGCRTAPSSRAAAPREQGLPAARPRIRARTRSCASRSRSTRPASPRSRARTSLTRSTSRSWSSKGQSDPFGMPKGGSNVEITPVAGNHSLKSDIDAVGGAVAPGWRRLGWLTGQRLSVALPRGAGIGSAT